MSGPIPWTGCYDAKQRTQSKGATMVPADDEQQSESTAPQIAAGNPPPTASSDSTARLTPMPAWLMHWWTPLAIAEGLLRWTLLLAFFWEGQPHWPSSKAMKLCMTITGAGLAFSAWQQRSHDNAIREEERTKAQQQFEQELRDREQDRLDKQHQFDVEREERETNRLEQIERDEYWKRREQIYHLLGSKNPGLRLGAVALLAELADSAAHSTLLNDTEKQQLQRHIIDTLCLQLRREGLLASNEGEISERAEIQNTIINTLLDRIDSQAKQNNYAQWDSQKLSITQCIILTPVTIYNLTTKSNLDLNNSIFQKPLEIRDSHIEHISWHNTTFQSGLFIQACSIGTNALPSNSKCTSIENTTIKSDNAYIDITAPNNTEFSITISDSRFTTKACTCNALCECKQNATNNSCACTKSDRCTCNGNCIRSTIELSTPEDIQYTQKETKPIIISSCTIASLHIFPSHNQPPIAVEHCIITKGLYIQYDAEYEEITNTIRSTYYDNSINILHNTFYPTQPCPPIMVDIPTSITEPTPISFIGNQIVNPNNKGDARTILVNNTESEEEAYLFFEASPYDPNKQLIKPWYTGAKFDA